MSFKSDWSFLDKITMGAAGTRKVIELLNKNGHNVIELERYCTSNKIWSTKIKRLRMPDLLCLKCGKRIESRAKSKLGIIMSDTENNPDRRWFAGLRDEDIVAFIACYKDTFDNWVAKETVNLFSVTDLLESESATKLGPPKSANEGSERDRTWKSYTPKFTFTVQDIINEESETPIIKLRNLNNGGNRSRKVHCGEYIYVNRGESYEANEKIITGIVSKNHSCNCSADQYDFYNDLKSDSHETKYAAVKALGYLQNTESVITALKAIAESTSTDTRIRLEAFSSLIRLGEDVWNDFTDYMHSLSQIDMKMEYVLIMGELATPFPDKVTFYLNKIIFSDNCEDEVASAAIWSLPNNSDALKTIIPKCFSTISVIRNHAIAKIEKYFSEDLTSDVLAFIGDDTTKNAICSHILTHSLAIDKKAVVNRYIKETNELIKTWILFIIGLSDRSDYQKLIVDNDTDSENTLSKLEVLWECAPHFLSKEEVDGIDFIKQQN